MDWNDVRAATAGGEGGPAWLPVGGNHPMPSHRASQRTSPEPRAGNRWVVYELLAWSLICVGDPPVPEASERIFVVEC